MKKIYKKSIVPSLLTICLLLAMLVGATYALFTSEARVNIAVTSGTVNITAEITDFEIYSLDVLQQDRFENGGTATLDNQTGLITLNLITPGDKVKFNIVVHNNSNVTIQHRTNISTTEDNGLFSGLEAYVGGNRYYGNDLSSSWSKLDPTTSQIIIPVEIGLPVEAGNEYQNKTCTLSVVLEAVQGNGVQAISDASELVAAIANGGDVVLGADVQLNADQPIVVASGVKTNLDLNGHTITFVSNESSQNVEAFTVQGELTVQDGTITLEHTGSNMAWNAMTTIFEVTGHGVVYIWDANVTNLGGTDMAFAVHITNNGGKTASVYANNSTIASTYCAIRLFNNSVGKLTAVVTNSNVYGNNRAFWVHFDTTLEAVAADHTVVGLLYANDATLSGNDVKGRVIVGFDVEYHTYGEQGSYLN